MIEEVVGVDGYLLMVYYSPSKCYQFLVIDEEGRVHQFESGNNTPCDGVLQALTVGQYFMRWLLPELKVWQRLWQCLGRQQVNKSRI